MALRAMMVYRHGGPNDHTSGSARGCAHCAAPRLLQGALKENTAIMTCSHYAVNVDSIVIARGRLSLQSMFIVTQIN